jgi:hypothetical protein
MNKRSLLLKLLVLAGSTLVMPASAFTGTYDGDCKSCHGALKVGGGSVGGLKALSKTMTANDILAAKGKAGMAFVKDVVDGGEYSDSIRNSVAAEVQAGGIAPPANTAKPILNQINTSYDTEVGQPLSIVLEVMDADEDTVDVTAKPNPAGATISAGELSVNTLPTFNFDWTPVSGQENKVYKVKFTAKENATAKKYSSNSVATSIRVWPAGNRDQTSIKKFVLASAKWKDGKLSLKGSIQFNKLLTKEEKAAYMIDAPTMNFTVTQGSDGLGAEVLNLPTMVTTSKGGWTITDIDLPASPAFDCSVSMDFEGAKAARKISGAPKDCTTAP